MGLSLDLHGGIEGDTVQPRAALSKEKGVEPHRAGRVRNHLTRAKVHQRIAQANHQRAPEAYQ